MAQLVSGPGFDPRVVVTRPDGRPEVYDIMPEGNEGVQCIACLGTDRAMNLYTKGRIFMCSPIDSSDGQAHMVCIDHLPDNVVIYEPATDLCRSKDGQTVWREGVTQ